MSALISHHKSCSHPSTTNVCVCVFSVAGAGGRPGRGFLKVRTSVHSCFPLNPCVCSAATQAAVLEIAACGFGCSCNKHCLSPRCGSPLRAPTEGRRAHFTGPGTADAFPESCCFCSARFAIFSGPHTNFICVWEACD